MTSISLNTNSLAYFYTQKAKAIINNASKPNQKPAIDQFMVQEQDAPGESSSIQNRTRPSPTVTPGKSGSVQRDTQQTLMPDDARLTDWLDQVRLTESQLTNVIRNLAGPSILTGILCPGEKSDRVKEFGEELAAIVTQYFDTVKEEFGCPTRDYMPYQQGLPEYDPEIAKQMTDALYEMVLSNPRCESLIRSKGGIWPPPRPEEFDPMTMCYTPGGAGRWGNRGVGPSTIFNIKHQNSEQWAGYQMGKLV